MKKTICLLSAFFVLLTFGACERNSGKAPSENADLNASAPSATIFSSAADVCVETAKNVVKDTSVNTLESRYATITVPPCDCLEGDFIYDCAVFDVDGDGDDERCCLTIGPTSGIFTYYFTAYGKDGNVRYKNLCYYPIGSLSFKESDGKYLLCGCKNNGTDGSDDECECYFVSAENGNIVLTPAV